MARTSNDLMIRELKDSINQLTETINSLNKTIESLRAREAYLQEQNDYLTKKLFGKSSEKNKAPIEGQSRKFAVRQQTITPMPIAKSDFRHYLLWH